MNPKNSKPVSSGLIGTLCCILFTAALPGFGRNGGNHLQIKIESWETGPKKEVKDDTSHLIIEQVKPGAAEEDETIVFRKGFNSLPVPENSLAARIKDSKSRIRWQPRWRFYRLGGPWLPASALSEDQSVFAVVETTGEKEGPNGSRILLFNTYNWKIIRLIDVKERKIAILCFIPGTDKLACWADKQVILKQSPELMIINCRNGNKIASTEVVTEPVTAMCAGAKGKKLFIGSAQSDFIRVVDVPDLSSVKNLPFPEGATALTVDPDNTILAAGGKNELTLFSLKSWEKIGSFKINPGKTVEKMLFIGKKNLIAVDSGGSALFCQGQNPRTLVDNAMPEMVLVPEENELALVLKVKCEIRIFQIPAMQKLYSAFPTVAKPRTQKDPLYFGYLAHYKSFLILDEEGILYFVYKSGKRWQKYLILTPYRQ